MLTRFKENILEKKLFSPADRLLLAVSGGVDSVILTELCHRAKFNFEIAHANFQLRGDESTADENFVRHLAAHYQVPIHVRSFDTASYAGHHRCSIQVAARELRYAWFRDLLNNGFQYLLTAHHAGDNVETVLMNFFRGTGISGLKGIPEKQENIIRPLLHIGKDEILQFAKENNLKWREDSSNASDKYSRNYFRNVVIPAVYKIYPEAEGNLLQNIERFNDINELYNQAIGQHKKKLLEYKGNEVHVPILKLKKSEPLHSILYEIIKPYNFTSHQVPDVAHLADAGQGRYVQSSSHKIFVNRGWLIISPLNTESAAHILIDQDNTTIRYQGRRLSLSLVPAGSDQLSNSRGVADLDMRLIKFPLCLRRWRTGDYFYPLGMKKKKKVSRFLIDLKLSATEKEKVWVIETGKKICWIVGMRIDDRFKVQPATKQLLRLTVENSI